MPVVSLWDGRMVGVEVLARFPEGGPVAVKQKNLLACAFHPELSRDLRFHAYFLNMLSG